MIKKSWKLKVEISRSESATRILRHIAFSTHKNVEISRAETMCTFSLVYFCILQICKETVTDRQIHRQSLLEDASRIKKLQAKGR